MPLRESLNLLMYVLVLQGMYVISWLVDISSLRLLTGVAILTFIPGILFLRIVLKEKISSLELSEIVVYSLGISLSFWAFLNFLINNIILIINKFTYIEFRLFTELIIVSVINAVVLTLILLNLKFKFNSKPFFIINLIKFNYLLKDKNTIITLLLSFLIFLLSILGICLINLYNINTFALLSILAIACISFAVTSNKIPTQCLPFVIWIVGLSLLYLNSLLGPYFRATDNVFEYYLSNLILKKSYWDPSIPNNLNAMLCVVMNLPTYSLFCSASLNLIFKVVVPFIASFIPVGLYVAFKRITNEKIAFLSTFFFISIYEFYTWAGLTMKMVTAHLYMTLLIMVLTDSKLDRFSKNILLVIFGFSLAVSHYGTSYIFMFCILGAFLVNTIVSKFIGKYHNNVILTPIFVILYITFTISWYLYISSSSPYINLVKIGDHIIRSIFEGYILPRESYIYEIVKGALPIYLQILKVLYMVTSTFLVIGLIFCVIHALLKLKLKLKFTNVFNNNNIVNNNEYLALSILYCIAGGIVFLGGLSGAATPDRIYLIISTFLAPFCILGGVILIDFIKNIILKKIKDNLEFDSLKLLNTYFIIFLLFNTCFVAEVVWKYNVGPMISISMPRIVENGTIKEKEYVDRVYIFPVNVIGAKWLKKYMVNHEIYCTVNSEKNFVVANITKSNVNRFTNKTKIAESSYIYLSEFNVKTGKMKISRPVTVLPKFVNVTDNPVINIGNKIYTNERCFIFYYSR